MEQLFDLLEQGVTAPHVISYLEKDLNANGFKELSLEDVWKLEENGKYYVNLYGSSGIAFTIGRMGGKMPSFRIAMAHSDYPNFQLKPEPMIKGKYVTRFNVEIYGGMYQKSWLDHPLGVAGKVVIKGDNAFSPKVLLYKSKRPICIIPSLAIHMDGELNKKGALDTAKELVPVTALSENADLLGEVAESLHITRDEILDYDLYLYNMEKPVIVGLDESMVAAPRLDNITSVGAILSGIKNATVPEGVVDLLVVFDNEEVGSRSKQGADSELLPIVVQKIGQAISEKAFALSSVLQKSFLLSVDVAHAHHPNYEEKSDATNKAYLGQGFCIKRSVGQKYGTTSESAAVLKDICEKNNIPYTVAVNKTGIPGGSTLGPIVTSHLPMPCADIGIPILSMHSICELGAVKDYDSLKKMMIAFYEA
ncbi:MAG: M18 family aminopeptidase [Lachnospiraceae bacterium]|nr:M18 family aminopeptidase [Lachnospiraceae bacterium]